MKEGTFKGIIIGFMVAVTILLTIINCHLVDLEQEHTEILSHILTIESEVSND